VARVIEPGRPLIVTSPGYCVATEEPSSNICPLDVPTRMFQPPEISPRLFPASSTTKSRHGPLATVPFSDDSVCPVGAAGAGAGNWSPGSWSVLPGEQRVLWPDARFDDLAIKFGGLVAAAFAAIVYDAGEGNLIQPCLEWRTCQAIARQVFHHADEDFCRQILGSHFAIDALHDVAEDVIHMGLIDHRDGLLIAMSRALDDLRRGFIRQWLEFVFVTVEISTERGL
jgi:hypothetical protein